ncbi:hypothetical protein Ava_2570 [Trichormus variabilis ATCC 29413]|uniref:Uncharacterized protein n=2 Tax=Anabaena variabilis TaxID=264691 RepID=Q3MA01_TRIV2|nr:MULTISPECIES: hypothetical protein [Nostocaceae]ABA22185.1 hypothetical protein Ava_2570 [Trichormus variabilis ATCC 29413]MBC1217691.1 hypothetical protein [Trichormus variabilis ARAD]MBC1259021.1 hypothetical protein [Trichormus variabilis V5]MBC1269212.1 hypothetical protein [Trichormus variabilis FSR]MBC1301277.1 hypothetical protein [Trichormus variabilis N2B]
MANKAQKNSVRTELTEAARLELTYHLAANPKPETATEAYLLWLAWCLEWQEMTKAQATEILEQTINKLTQALSHLSKS